MPSTETSMRNIVEVEPAQRENLEVLRRGHVADREIFRLRLECPGDETFEAVRPS